MEKLPLQHQGACECWIARKGCGDCGGCENLKIARSWPGFGQRQNNFGLFTPSAWNLGSHSCPKGLQSLVAVIFASAINIHCQKYFILQTQPLQQCCCKKTHQGAVCHDKGDDIGFAVQNTMFSRLLLETGSAGCSVLVNHLSSSSQQNSHGTEGKKLRMFLC